jgi:NADP-dependent 3-hydroxy acid dehydrogenase YdfG
MNTGKLIGKVAIVTGASSGIGEATAIALAKEGAKVAIAARRTDRLEALAQKITTMDGEVLTVTMDATDEAQLDCCALAREKMGRKYAKTEMIVREGFHGREDHATADSLPIAVSE